MQQAKKKWERNKEKRAQQEAEEEALLTLKAPSNPEEEQALQCLICEEFSCNVDEDEWGGYERDAVTGERCKAGPKCKRCGDLHDSHAAFLLTVFL